MLQLGPLRLDPIALRVQAAAGVVRLRPKAVALLVLLASRPGETFTKDELLDSLWPDRVVDEKNLAVLVGDIRRALAPFLEGEQAIATIPGSGYRLAVPVSDDAEIAVARQARTGWMATVPVSKPSVLMLPLRMPTSSGALAEAVDSITASMTTRLASVATVILPRRFADRFADMNATAEVAADLLVTGSVSEEGGRIRINVHVLDAVGRVVLWADQVTTNREDLFDAEDRLCERTAGRIAALCAQDRVPFGAMTCEPQVLRAYRLGRHFLGHRTASSLIRARDFFGMAFKADERFAPALVGLAQCRAVEAYYTDTDPRTCAERAVVLSSKALEIDSTLSQAFATSGFAHLNLLQWEKAAEHLRQALTIDPHDAEAWHYYSEYLTCSGRHEEAIRTMRVAVQLDPASRILNSDLGKTLMLAGRFDEAADQFRATIEMNPDFPLAYYRLGLALACQGSFAEALQTCDQAADLSSEVSLYGALRACCEVISGRRREATETLHRLKLRGGGQAGVWYGIALLHMESGERDLALDTLRHAMEKRAPLTIYAQVDPLLNGLRKMRGFQKLSHNLSGHV